jgi:glycosyltransferase involved in cell wall biosynthesis
VTLSIYTFAKDALFFDYHIVDMLRHHLPLADEIVVCEGHSTDGTYEAVSGLDPRIRVFRRHIDTSDPKSWLRSAKDHARRECRGDWCLLLDCDEFVPEWEFDGLRKYIATTTHDIASATYTHFYANYKVFYDNPSRPFPPRQKRILHRNRPDIEILGDGSDVRITGRGNEGVDGTFQFACHHFGEVRNAARLRHKWRVQLRRDVGGQWDWVPSFVYRFFPHNWLDADVLQYLHAYDGPFVKAVRDNPNEFVRDGFRTYDALCARPSKLPRERSTKES